MKEKEFGIVVIVPERVATGPKVPVNERLVMLVAPKPSAVTRPLSTALELVIEVAASVITVGTPTGHGSVVKETVAPEPVSAALFVALAVYV